MRLHACSLEYKDLTLAVGRKRQKVNWDQKLSGRNRLAQGRQTLCSPGCAGRSWALQPGRQSSISAFSMAGAVEELLLIDA